MERISAAKPFKDFLPAELEVVGEVKIQRGYYSDDIKPVSAADFKKDNYTYTFPDRFGAWSGN